MKFKLWFPACLVAIFLIAGCSVLNPPKPTATPAPTVPPTAAATATSQSSGAKATATSANKLPAAIAFALNKTQEARSMNFDFESGVTLMQDGKTQKVPGLAVKGVDSTLNRHVTISGTTTDTNEFITYDVVVVGEDVYIKGLSGVPGIDETQWYLLPASAQAGVRRLPTARGLMGSFDPAVVAKAEFESAGNETLDGENCSIWSAQNAENAQILLGVTGESDLKDKLGAVDKTEFKLWTCADGFIHQIIGQVDGHSTQNPSSTATVSMHFKLSDFEEALDIKAPTDAKPFPSQDAEPTSAATEPTEPAATEPALTEPAATEPAATSEAEPTSAATEPAVTPEIEATPTAAP